MIGGDCLFWSSFNPVHQPGSSGSEELLSNGDVHLTFLFVWQYPLQVEHLVCP